jgi:RNA polymerase sigma-70 factor (ECF subfamily)
MLGSGSEAEDAVQETMLRAWRNSDSFEGRSSVRSWLYRIATNVCLDMHRSVQRRARPMDLGPASPPDERFLGPLTPESEWVSPVADDRILPEHADPAEVAEIRDSVRLAFVSALQHLPGRQRASLILCEVLRWQASEVAELLDTSTASVNSALQRARATLASLPAGQRVDSVDADNAELLAKYVAAFERYDISELVKLLHEDAIQSMPPFAMWIKGADSIGTWMVQPGPMACEGSRLVPTIANGLPAFGQYRRDRENGGYKAWSLQVLQIRDGKIAEMTMFLDVEHIYPQFGLPLRLEA